MIFHLLHTYTLYSHPLTTYVHTSITATCVPSKKPKLEKKTRAEKGMERAMEAFLKYQMEAEERYTKQEDERWQKEMDYEERRRRMMELLGPMFRGGSHTYGTPYEFDDDMYHHSY